MLRAIACSGRIDVHSYAKVKTKIGQFWVGCSPAGLAMISAAQNPNAAFESAYQKLLRVKPRQGSIPKSTIRAIQDAVAGRPFNPVSIDLSSLSGFQSEVLKKLAKIPRGEVRPYSWLAREVRRLHEPWEISWRAIPFPSSSLAIVWCRHPEASVITALAAP